MYVQDPQFGEIVDFDWLRKEIHRIYDTSYPEYNMLAGAHVATQLSQNDPDVSISIGASALAYSIIIAADEYEIASQLKDKIFTLGWTEEHCGSDLLSVRTGATKINDDPDDKNYHVKGGKWLINCSFHADYHVVVAKTDPSRNDPRSLSFFLVPRSSTKNWERLETHILQGMVLTKFDIDGPAVLLGKVGHGLSILQRMAMPSKYQCTFMGVAMLFDAIPDSLTHLSTKNIFGNNPINFSNVFRQMYEIVLKATLYNFMFYRAVLFDTDGWLQFHGTILKSYLLLRINDLLSKNLLVAGSKGFLKTSSIGRSALDSFVLPVFDGHYTINTFMTGKFMPRFLNATDRVELSDRIEKLRDDLFCEIPQAEMYASPRDLRKPPFFDYADYIDQMELPFEVPVRTMLDTVRSLTSEIEERELGNDPEYRYKVGDLVHWMEAFVAACELWKLLEDDNYLNIVIIQYNSLTTTINNLISEGAFNTDFLSPIRQIPITGDYQADPQAFLMNLFEIQKRVEAMREPTTA